jgi:tRNA(fMet)-specific endonuclease VapC
MLDTNMASYIIKGRPPEARQRLEMQPMDSIVISAVTQGELLYGVARKGHPASLTRVVQEFLRRVDILPWDEEVAKVYGDLRATCANTGITLSALDMMIAAHSIATQSTLVTHDQVFSRITDSRFTLEDWIKQALLTK